MFSVLKISKKVKKIKFLETFNKTKKKKVKYCDCKSNEVSNRSIVDLSRIRTPPKAQQSYRQSFVGAYNR